MGIIRFGVEGWRARLDEGFDKDSVARIARALGETWSWRHPGATIVVGFDTRRDSARLALLCGQVLSSCGLVALVSDRPCPLAALEWAAAHDNACVGAVMLTAGGSSCKHGGIVARGADGGPVSEPFAEAVERAIAGNARGERGAVERVDVVSAYRDAVVARVRERFSALTPARVVVDPLYGASVTCACDIFAALGCDVVELHNQAVSDFRGLHPRAREPWVDECERTVRDTKASLGIVLDGDASHMGIIDHAGRLVSVHDLAPLALEYVVTQKQAADRVAATFATSLRLERQADYFDCPFTRVPGGFQSVYREFDEHDVILGADELGGIADPEHLVERDGLLSACYVASTLLYRDDVSSGAVVDELGARLGKTEWGTRRVPLDPASIQRLRNLLPGLNPGVVAEREPVSLSHAGGLRLSFADDSWLMINVAAECNAAQIYAEAPEAHGLSELLNAGVEMVKQGV